MPTSALAVSPPVASAAECAELAACLRRSPPEIPARYFYDDRGSTLFEEITQLPEYYQTRTEISILETHARNILRHSQPRRLVELGSGAGRKIRLLLDAAQHETQLARCTLLDVNELFLEQSLAALRPSYPGVQFDSLVGDFTADLAKLLPGGGRLILFFAGTIGNLYPEARLHFLRTISAQLAEGEHLLVGIDLIKDPKHLESAYNDAAGVTAAFNRNILAVVNQRFEADFRPADFAHVAFYDPVNHWIEMRLRALQKMAVHIRAADTTLQLARGDELRTEISTKFSVQSFADCCALAGLLPQQVYSDPEARFAQVLLGRKSHA